MESPDLLIDLAMVVSVATVAALLATVLRQSTIIGFILAGIAIGPHSPVFVGDVAAVEELANIGLVLLMFTIGIHISLAELRQVGRVAVGGGTLQVLAITGAGLGAGLLLGWGVLEATFFGAVLAISSGAVMSRLLGERGDLGTAHGRIALGWSAVQDFATIVLVVVLTALATGEENLASGVTRALVEAIVFIVVLIPIGSRLLPWLLKHVAALQNREVFILTIGSLALGTAYLSTLFGLSLALGAFVAGVVVAESDFSHQVLGESEPLRDIFSGIFFVSIGMFVDPGFVLANLPELSLAVAIIVLLKGFVIAALIRVSGWPLRTAALTGAALSQAGEFSFLLARLGGELEVVSATVFNLMLAGSAISMLLTAPVLRGADPLLRKLGAHRALMAQDDLDGHGSKPPVDDHVVLCGYGRVGVVIGTELVRRRIPFLVVEEDPSRVRSLEQWGIPTVIGYADLPPVLDQARLDRARLLIVAIPGPTAARRIIDHAREINPDLPIIARAHRIDVQQSLLDRGATEALVGEVELALEMTRFTLERYDVEFIEIQRMMRQRRSSTSTREQKPALP